MSPLDSKALPALMDYGFALLVTGLAWLVQTALYDYVQATPFLLFFGAVMLAGWKGGWGPGLLTVALSILVADYFFLPPRHQFSVSTRDAGSIALFVLIAVLITRLNVWGREARAQAELQQNRLRRLFLQAPAVVNTHLGPHHVFDVVHPLTYQRFGHRELVGRPVREAVPELEGQRYFEMLDRVYQTGEPFVGKAVQFHLPGEASPKEAFFDLTLQPMHDAKGRVEGVMVFAVDVTAEVLARRRLEASEERLRRATEVAGVGIWETDLVTGKTWHDEQCDRAFGSPPPLGEWTLEAFLQRVLPEDRERVRQELPRQLKERGQFELEFRVTWPDDSVHWLSTRGRIQRDSSGRPLKLVGTTLDITVRKRTEQELERAVLLRDEFLSVAAHELKTPLTPLSLKLQSLARALPSGSEAPDSMLRFKDVEAMRRQVQRLSSLVTNLLDVSRIGIGRLTLQREPVDLPELVREVASRMAPEAERSRCPLDLDLGGALLGAWDRMRLEQVVENLLSNAIKYGAGTPIRLQVREVGGQARLVVRDEGIGIAPEALGRIFGRFERAVSERHYGGLGLGLYITREIVSALGGTVRAESRPGEGATFVVELPLGPPG